MVSKYNKVKKFVPMGNVYLTSFKHAFRQACHLPKSHPLRGGMVMMVLTNCLHRNLTTLPIKTVSVTMVAYHG